MWWRSGLGDQEQVEFTFLETRVRCQGGLGKYCWWLMKMMMVTGSLPCPSLPQVLSIWLREGRMWVWLLLACQVAARTENREKIALRPQLADRIP